LETNISELCGEVARGAIGDIKPRFSDEVACGVVVAAPGYPGTYPKRLAVELPGEAGEGQLLFHASTSRGSDGRVLTGGGRCFTAVGLGKDWPAARSRVYELARKVRFEGAWFRPDIGEKIYGGVIS
jgi:phosphoribosylamine-glycine ligase